MTMFSIKIKIKKRQIKDQKEDDNQCLCSSASKEFSKLEEIMTRFVCCYLKLQQSSDLV